MLPDENFPELIESSKEANDLALKSNCANLIIQSLVLTARIYWIDGNLDEARRLLDDAHVRMKNCPSNLLSFEDRKAVNDFYTCCLFETGDVVKSLLVSESFHPNEHCTYEGVSDCATRENKFLMFVRVISNRLIYFWLVVPDAGLLFHRCCFLSSRLDEFFSEKIEKIKSVIGVELLGKKPAELKHCSAVGICVNVSLQYQNLLLCSKGFLLKNCTNIDDLFANSQPIQNLNELFFGEKVCKIINEAKTVNQNINKLSIIMDSKLQTIPFSLFKSKPNEFICSNYDIQCAFSLKDATSITSRDSSATLASVFGSSSVPPHLTSQFPFSKGSFDEIITAASLLNVPAKTGSAANKSHVMVAMETSEIVHLAFNVSQDGLVLCDGDHRPLEVPSTPFLELNIETKEDGKKFGEEKSLAELDELVLSFDEISRLDLRGCGLVVLGAPYLLSGNTLENSIFNLSSSLLAAGATSVLMCLWPVPESVHRVFLETFYKSLRRGRTNFEACSEAKRKIRSTNNFAHPSYWASYVLIGGVVKVDAASTFAHSLAKVLDEENSRQIVQILSKFVDDDLLGNENISNLLQNLQVRINLVK